jgi:prepilin-type N-terminal cleavage/methylation domain-containing protein/prepilin-type processing-associated H-X9-DG protein
MVQAAPRRRGFTLVELLVVIAVLGVLAAIFMPVLTQARERARRTVCLSQLRQIAQAHQLYTLSWDERYPDWLFPNSPPKTPTWRMVYWPELLQPYLRCPGVLRDPSVRQSPYSDILADYALLSLGTGGEGTWESPYWKYAGAQLTVGHVSRPSETVCLTDGRTSPGDYGANPTRHRGGSNYAFLDGRVRWMRIGERSQRLDDGRGFYWMRFYTADR